MARALGAVSLTALGLFLFTALGSGAELAQAAPCDPPIQNAIVCENSKPGNPQSEWDVSGGGDPNIQGFATDISVDQGQTVHFKIDTTYSAYHLDIYRMGYYGGDGARKVATVPGLAQNQAPCLDDSTTGLIDCGNWAESASWAVPADAVSGIYFAKLVRDGGASDGSHIFFIVRDDASHSNLLFQTSDTTWEAYNQYGGRSLYSSDTGGPGTNPDRAYKVSYNRPLTVRGGIPEDSPFNAEYPMVRWLERNGYDVSYFTGVDSARFGSQILQHKTFLSVGHDEYWSGTQRANIEAARAAGVNLAFFSGNESFWKTRWEPSTAGGSTTDWRTLVSYKETHANAKIDPGPPGDPNVWTGTWRDPRFSPPADGGRPENAVTGTMFRVNSGTSAIDVPAADGKMRIWRNTSIASQAPGQTATLSDGTLGYEWDEAPDNATRPAGLVPLSSTTRSGVQVLQDFGSTYGSGTATHNLTLYRAASGALVFGAGTIQWSWGLDGNHDRGSSTPDPRMQQATVNLLADMGAQPGTLQAGLVTGTASTDTDPPTATISSPLAGSNVEAGAPTTISGTASDAVGETAGGEVGSVEVSTDGGSSWHPAQGRDQWTYSWTPGATGSATIKVRAVDDSGNIGTPDQVTVNVIPRTCPCSIWDDSFTLAAENDPNAVELGVKFRSDQAGFITGLRFYKTSGNTGTHVGHLWTANGTQLAEATFSGETASGWQQVSFDSPVAIDANTTYIASYHAPNGDYAASNNYFATGGFDSAPLHALGDGVDGPNGIYKYGPSGGLFSGTGPETFQSSNYGVDVVFENTVGPDTTPPTINARSPAGGATNVSTDANVTATFNEPMDPATINGTNFELRDSSNALVPATVTYNAAQRKATLDPSSALQNSTTYTATVKGGPGGVTDDASPANALASDSTWSFTTAAPPPPPPDEGPGGPILVISNAANPFSRYFAEILRAEGLNEFTATDISNVTPATLNAHDVAILGDGALSSAQAQMLSDWVQAGGNLIASRPDPQLAGLLGLTPAGSPLSNEYLKVDTTSGPGAGIVGQTIQYHGAADRYTTNGAQTIATLYSDATTATSNPAVTMRSVGSNGGHAAAFTYDLARSIVETRQGNPAWSGDERDSSVGGNQLIRSDDLFFGAKAGDVQPDWVDLNKVAIPQADEQQHLLTNLIEQMNLEKKPLPRFWFLPRDLKAAVVMTGDDHANGGTVGRFQQYESDSPPGCSVADWQCVRGTSYIYPNTPISDAQVADFQSQGFEIALHTLTNCENWDSQAQLEGFYSSQLAALAASYPSINAPTTNRTHCIAWSDWATQPKVELENGVRLDANYYYWPADWIQDRPGMFTGSGMPMRFADLNGSMIDVYQAATQMTDESGQSEPANIDSLLNKALGPEGYYGVFTANMHTDSASSSGSDAIVASAQSHNVPVVSARQMLTWLDGRNNSSFGGVTWNGNKLDFTIAPFSGSNGLRAMVPTSSSVGQLTGVTRNGSPVQTTARTIKGTEYAFIDGTAGNYEATYAVDNTAPAISNVSASAPGDGTASVTWDTNEASDSRVDYGTSPGSLDSHQSSPGLTTSHSVQLTGLAPNTTFYYRVVSTDAATNSATDPNPPAAPRSFTTPSASFTDTTVSDFGAGTPDANTYISEMSNGEVILKPAEGQEFSGGPGLPAGWGSQTWESQGGGAGGSATVSGGALHVDGAFAGTNATFGAGHSLDFEATFGAASFQHVAFTDNFNSAWAMFSTRGSNNQLFTSTNTGGGATDTPIGGQYIGSAHKYRIQWDAGQVQYYVDGTLVHTDNATFGPNLNVAASDFNSGGPGLSVNWLHLSPYPSSGTFTSRVFDAGQAADWGAMSWHANAPPGTSLAMSVRTGNTPTPDGSWSAFTPVTSSGDDVPGNSRYVQYRAGLGSSDPNQAPALSDVSIAYGTGTDTTAPTITQRTPAPGATNVPRNTNVDVQFSEAMNPATIDSSTVRLRKQGAGSDVPANVTYVGNTATIDPNADLDPSAVYNVTVAGTVTDANGNQLGADDTWSFTTASLSFIDTTVSDFSAGTPGANTYVPQTNDGEVTLKPTVGEEFFGSSVPAGWTSCPWTTSEPPCPAGATVSGGALHANGAYARTDTAYLAGRSLEFVATFNAVPFETAGFATDLNAPPWATFSTKADGNTLYTRTDNGQSGGQQETALGSNLLGSPHLYRIEWGAGDVKFYVDGGLVATHTVSFPQNMRVIASEFNSGGPELTVDWMRMSPYPGSGTFDSRVFDAGAGQISDWGALSWNSAMPSGTGIAISVRTGDTPTPDGTWSAFTPIASSGGDIPGSTRYVQYRAALTSSDPAQTPVLSDVSIGYVQGGDNTAPTITGRSPSPNATNVPRDTNVQVQFSEPMNPATIGASSVHLRKQGSGTDVPASVSYSGTTATLDPNADLDPSAVYTVTVDGSVEDLGGNALGAPDSWSFTTAAPSFNFTDTTVSDFSAGTPGANTYVSQTGNGEVILKPTEGQEFSGGPGLPAGWSSTPWGAGGSASLSGGSMHVDGALAGTTATFTPGHSLEFSATFGADAFQHVALTDNFNNAWAMFSTRSSTSQLYASTNASDTGGIQDTPIGAPNQYVGSQHLYRIQWDATQVQYYVDGTLVHTQAATFTQNLNVATSDFNVGGPELSLDWLHLSPYPASGTFDSRVFDAGPGQSVDWGALSWNSVTPSGTGLAISVRTGDTPAPDGTWSAFTPIATSGGDIPGASRYLQYRAALSTTDPNLTPTLNDVTVNGAGDIPPTAVNDTKTVAQGSGATAIDVLANDTDPDGGPKTIASATQPAHGTVAVAPDNLSLTYTPNPGYCNSNPPASTDDFTYTLNGGSTATVAVTVSCAADIPPTAVNDTKTVAQGSGATAIDVLANDTDPDGGPKTIASATQPAHGTVAVAPDNLSLTYTPNPGYCNSNPPASTDDFTYTLNGGSTATVAVTVSCAADIPPTAVNDTKTVAQGSGATAIDVLANDTDPDGGPKTIASATQPAHGTVAVAPDNLSLTYTPNPGYCNSNPPASTDDFTYTLNGGSTATVAVTVSCAADIPPTAVNDTKTVAQGSGATAIDVLANDTDPDGGPKTIASATQPAHGTVAVAPDNLSLTYTPNPGYCNSNPPASTDDFTYTLNGGSTATVAVTVSCAANPPSINFVRPAEDATEVQPNPVMVVAFDRSMDKPSTQAAFSLKRTSDGAPVSGAFGWYGPATLLFQPDAPLAPGTQYTATVTTAAKDLAGNPLAAAKSWQFTTSNPPIIKSVSPADGASNVAPGALAIAFFNKDMDKASAQAAFSLKRTSDGAPVSGAFGWYGPATLLFQPDAPLAPGTQYTATVTTAAKDLAGNPLQAAKSWQFTTSNPPIIKSVSPADGASNVAPGALTIAFFNKDMDKASAQAAFSLKRTSDGAPVSGAFGWYGPATLLFKPDADLAPGTQYTATVTTAAKDLAGNPLQAAKSWQFTTSNPPIIKSVSPADGASNVAPGALTIAFFNKDMDKASAQAAFSLKRTSDGAPVSGAFGWYGPATLLFKPDVDLAPGTQYTATVTTVAKDLAGNALANPVTWSYTTGPSG